MAQIDTGLGWSAKDTYLSSLGPVQMGTLAGMTDPNGVFVEIPGGLTTALEVAQGGYCYAENSTYKWMCAAEDNVQVYVFKPTGQYYLVGVKMGYGGKILTVRVKKSDGSTSRFDYKKMNDSQGNGLYSGSATMGTGNWEVPSGATIHLPELGTGSTLSAIINNAISTNIVLASQDWYKLNPGYAVCCFATYNNMDGGKTITPVLISTEFSATILSNDGSTQATFVTYSYLKDGRRFYMSMVPTSTLNVSTSTVTHAMLTNFAVLVPEGVFNALARSDWANITILESVDPYGEPTLDNDGGDETPDSPDPEDIPFSMPPYITASDSGFVTLFNPTESQLRALASFMWSSGFDLDTLKRLYASPIDYIIGASIVPVIPSLKEASHAITLPGVVGPISTGVSMDVVYQYSTVNCGSMFIGKKHGAYLDYSPYSHYQIWLPYIGFRDIDADDITGKTIELQYLVDLLSGACNAELKCGGTVLYSWQGQCGAQIPINSADWSSMFSGAISLAASAVKLGASIATGGAGIASVATDVASMGMAATGMKPSISRGGTVAGAAGFMAAQTPYIVYTRPERAISARQNEISGYPSFVTMTLGDLTGYNEIYRIHLENIPATETELAELDGILKGGVIF